MSVTSLEIHPSDGVMRIRFVVRSVEREERPAGIDNTLHRLYLVTHTTRCVGIHQTLTTSSLL